MPIEYVSNEDITFESFVLISDDGENLGRKTKQEALEIASDKEMDVILVNPDEKNPVCKILDLGKKIYEDRIKEKENRSSHRKQKVKEVRLSVHTDPHDMQTKAKSVDKFLKHGLKVKINIRFPKRQKDTIRPIVQDTMDQLVKYLSEGLEYEIGKGSYSENNYFTEITPSH